jgi:hypothetical protein
MHMLPEPHNPTILDRVARKGDLIVLVWKGSIVASVPVAKARELGGISTLQLLVTRALDRDPSFPSDGAGAVTIGALITKAGRLFRFFGGIIKNGDATRPPKMSLIMDYLAATLEASQVLVASMLDPDSVTGPSLSAATESLVGVMLQNLPPFRLPEVPPQSVSESETQDGTTESVDVQPGTAEPGGPTINGDVRPS